MPGSTSAERLPGGRGPQDRFCGRGSMALHPEGPNTKCARVGSICPPRRRPSVCQAVSHKHGEPGTSAPSLSNPLSPGDGPWSLFDSVILVPVCLPQCPHSLVLSESSWVATGLYFRYGPMRRPRCPRAAAAGGDCRTKFWLTGCGGAPDSPGPAPPRPARAAGCGRDA